jgi:hypothetical protein
LKPPVKGIKSLSTAACNQYTFSNETIRGEDRFFCGKQRKGRRFAKAVQINGGKASGRFS